MPMHLRSRVGIHGGAGRTERGHVGEVPCAVLSRCRRVVGLAVLVLDVRLVPCAFSTVSSELETRLGTAPAARLCVLAFPPRRHRISAGSQRIDLLLSVSRPCALWYDSTCCTRVLTCLPACCPPCRRLGDVRGGGDKILTSRAERCWLRPGAVCRRNWSSVGCERHPGPVCASCIGCAWKESSL